MKPGPAKLWPDVAPEWILNLPENLEEFCYRIYKALIYDDRYQMYIEGLFNTLLLTFVALLMGIVIGVVIALIRSTWDKNSMIIPWAQIACIGDDVVLVAPSKC